MVGPIALAISPHTDDAELGAGAVLARLVEEGVDVRYLALSTGNPETGATEAECRAACRQLGIVELGRVTVLNFPTRAFAASWQAILDTLIQVRRRLDAEPAWVFGPSSVDHHQDHVVVHAEMGRAFPRSTVLGYHVPWLGGAFDATCRWAVEPRHLRAKLAALSCYRTQARREYMQPEIVWGMATLAAMGLGSQYAEGFEVVRWVNR
jgi:LmbE family N-acetylglucosaminyl deacetylase